MSPQRPPMSLELEPAAARRIACFLKEEAGVREVLAMLDGEGEEARIVGGTVRNLILGAAIGDIDIATTALPQEVMRRAAAAGMKVVPTGIDHGTVTIVHRGRPFEVTTLRQDVETFGRHASVRFGRSWRADALRRDFTMNALSLARDGRVFDAVGGMADLSARRVRFIGEARTRIREDYLRILRLFRFHALVGQGPIDAEGLAAAVAEREGLRRLSAERIGQEMRRLLLAPGAAEAVAILSETGLYGIVLAGIAELAAFRRLVRDWPDAGIELRLAALAVRIEEDVETLSRRLRLSNAERERVLAAHRGARMLAGVADERGARIALYRLGARAYEDGVMLMAARAALRPDDPRIAMLRALPRRWQAPRFPVRGADVLARGVPPGPEVGRALAEIEARWVAAGFDPAAAWTALDALTGRAG